MPFQIELKLTRTYAAPGPSPPPVHPRERPGVNPYRHDTRPQQAVFDLDLDLNPDL